MRVLVSCFTNVSGGGGSTLGVRIALGLADCGHKVTFLEKDGKTRDDENGGVFAGRDIDRISFNLKVGIFWRVPNLVLEKQILRFFEKLDEKFDCLVAVSPYFIAPFKKRFPHARIIYAFPCLNWRALKYESGKKNIYWRLNRRLMGCVEKRALSYSDYIIAQSSTVVQDIVSYLPSCYDSLRVCPTGVMYVEKELVNNSIIRKKFREEQGMAPDSKVILCCGRFSKNKDYGFVIRAFGGLDLPNSYLCLAGDGFLRRQLEDLTKELGLSHRVKFLGWRDDMTDIYLSSDIFVHAAFYDNFPNVYLEAMMCGLPVVGPMHDFPDIISPLVDIIENGVQGIVYEKTAPRKLTEALSFLLLSESRRLEIGMRARQLALKYSWEKYISLTDNLIKESRE